VEQISEPRTADRLELSVPPDPGSVAMARMFAASVARHFGCDEDVVEDVKVAMSEACTNAVKAHESAGVSEPIRIIAAPIENGLQFEVIDAGEGIDPTGTAVDPTATPPSGLYEGSLGLVLIRSLFGSLDIGQNRGRGTRVRFTATVSAEAAAGFYSEPD
jgi:serine/threonine-protein kinase RsbW